MRLFLSHSGEDKAFVRMVAGDVRACDIEIWIDERELGVGDTFMDRIGQAIDDADYVAVFLSPHSLGSRWVQEEMGLAEQVEQKRGGVRLLPLLVPGLKESVLPSGLARRVFLDLRRPERYLQAFDKLLQTVNPRALPLASLRSYGLTFTASRKQRLLALAGELRFRSWALEHLTAQLRTGQGRTPDPTERYWLYVALGELGGEQAMAQLAAGLEDPDSYARNGAQRALHSLRTTEVRPTRKGG